jgi:hypothetical protein
MSTVAEAPTSTRPLDLETLKALGLPYRALAMLELAEAGAPGLSLEDLAAIDPGTRRRAAAESLRLLRLLELVEPVPGTGAWRRWRPTEAGFRAAGAIGRLGGRGL